MSRLLSTAVICSWLALSASQAAGNPPDFNREVRPILSNHCFKCHGPDDKARKGKLRLDLGPDALLPAKSGDVAIVPGKADDSELVHRIDSTDEDEQMPPPSAKKALSAAQKDVLRRWIAGGAKYDAHWAFVAPKQPVLPSGAPTTHPIDALVRARLASEDLAPSPEADRATLLRRVSFDLVGLPPTPAELDAFLSDKTPEAYEKVVDRLLASPSYGERWARRWLDLARYSDTNGYEKDRERSVWPWRDWVIRAINADMPFDQFTIEQLAGDLLPNATPDQIVATGFHRNTMLNEEGGIDPLEFRFHAMTDRVATTGKTWLGLTVGCAQCHTHKFDPITHHEYFGIFAFLNNADEPDYDLPAPGAQAQREASEGRAAKLLAELPSRWPVEKATWKATPAVSFTTASGDQPKVLEDGSALFGAATAEKDVYTVTVDSDLAGIDRLRLETLADASLPAGGPGRVAHGNFVLTEVTVTAAAKGAPEATVPVKLVRAQADAEQVGMPASAAIDGDPATGWAVHSNTGKWNVSRTATFTFEKAVSFPAGTRFTVRLAQEYGQQHTIGRVRLSVGAPAQGTSSDRGEIVKAKFEEWLVRERARAIAWNPLKPVEAKSNSPLLTVQPDASVLASGDTTKSDTYDLKFHDVPRGITALRLEALPDASLPRHGPGLAYYEGPKGDFFMTNFAVTGDAQPLKIAKATESYAKNAMGGAPAGAAQAVDTDLQTGWSTSGREGEASEAVFAFSAPVAAREMNVQMSFGRHYAASLGKFRISVTTQPAGAEARDLPETIARALATPDALLTADARAKLREHFLLTAPELASAAAEIKQLRKPASHTTTLVLRERPSTNPRPTFLHHRGEYLEPKERVEPAVPAILNPLPAGAPRDRLTFARWLVSPDNPLTARVTVNRAWAAFFGRGLVKSVDDFGYQGDSPTHPELLDRLALEFIKQGWSMKKLHRLIVTSATYRQSSRTTPDLLARDPDNRLLARGPRARLEAEMIRDSALRVAGLLTEKVGGPSVRPPQPDGVTEVAYGGGKWNASSGPDRYRRSLYTFSKRTAPFALFTTFDAPSGDTCVAHRETSDTPLQALTVLNDVVFLEAAQALGKTIAAQPGDDAARIAELFRRAFARAPEASEQVASVQFLAKQRARFSAKELNPVALAGKEADPERAAWTALVRALFNTDEAITKG